MGVASWGRMGDWRDGGRINQVGCVLKAKHTKTECIGACVLLKVQPKSLRPWKG